MISKELFGKMSDGKEVNLYRLENANGNYVEIMDYGCKIKSIVIKNANGDAIDCCLGYDTVKGYEDDTCFFGTVVGRYANRIARATFTLNGIDYAVEKNEGENHLHGGSTHYGNRVWDSEVSGDTLVFTRVSQDMEEGYPGELKLEVRYRFDDDNRLSIAYNAVTDKDTVLNLTNHSYFNLSGDLSQTILNHKLMIPCQYYTPVYSDCIPTGEIASVENTPFDFLQFHEIGERIDQDNEQLDIGSGYDHNYAFGTNDMKLAAVLECEESGLRMKCHTDEPGMQLYTGNHVKAVGKNGVSYGKRTGVCLETQHYPDSMHHENFPSPILKAGETYQSTTIYEFECM